MPESDPEPGLYSKTSIIQFLYGIWVNMTTLSFGLAYGFPAIQIPQLTSPVSNIYITLEEESWIASVLILFCPVGCLIGGYMSDKYGRRPSFWFCQISMCLGWMCTGVAQSARQIIIGRALVGIGGGMGLGVPRLYTTEISLSKMRGVLGTFPNIFLSLGIAIQAAMGIYFDWKMLCFISSIFNVILFISYLFLSESPHYLLLHDHVHKARRVLARFRSKTYPVDTEMNALLEFKRDQDIRRLKFTEQIVLYSSSVVCKPFLISMTYVVFLCLSGLPIVTIWTISILMWAHSSYDVHIGYVLITATRLIVGSIASFTLFCVGRRPMALISASGVGSSSLFMGLFLLYHSDPTIVPQIMLMVYIAFASIGYQSLPFLIMTEMYPLQVRGTLIGISLTITNVLVFLSTKYFPYLYEAIGLPNSFIIFSISSFLAFVFLYLALPETKNMTLQDIEKYFSGVRQRPPQQLPGMEKTISIVRLGPNLREDLERERPMTSTGSKQSINLSHSSTSLMLALRNQPI